MERFCARFVVYSFLLAAFCLSPLSRADYASDAIFGKMESLHSEAIRTGRIAPHVHAAPQAKSSVSSPSNHSSISNTTAGLPPSATTSAHPPSSMTIADAHTSAVAAAANDLSHNGKSGSGKPAVPVPSHIKPRPKPTHH